MDGVCLRRSLEWRPFLLLCWFCSFFLLHLPLADFTAALWDTIWSSESDGALEDVLQLRNLCQSASFLHRRCTTGQHSGPPLYNRTCVSQGEVHRLSLRCAHRPPCYNSNLTPKALEIFPSSGPVHRESHTACFNFPANEWSPRLVGVHPNRSPSPYQLSKVEGTSTEQDDSGKLSYSHDDLLNIQQTAHIAQLHLDDVTRLQIDNSHWRTQRRRGCRGGGLSHTI